MDTAHAADTNAPAENGSAAPAEPASPAQPAVSSPFAASDNGWQRAKEAVQRSVGVSTAFKTLRDMRGSDVIRPDQLHTLRVLGQGAFATVDAAM